MLKPVTLLAATRLRTEVIAEELPREKSKAEKLADQNQSIADMEKRLKEAREKLNEIRNESE